MNDRVIRFDRASSAFPTKPVTVVNFTPSPGYRLDKVLIDGIEHKPVFVNQRPDGSVDVGIDFEWSPSSN